MSPEITVVIPTGLTQLTGVVGYDDESGSKDGSYKVQIEETTDADPAAEDVRFTRLDVLTIPSGGRRAVPFSEELSPGTTGIRLSAVKYACSTTVFMGRSKSLLIRLPRRCRSRMRFWLNAPPAQIGSSNPDLTTVSPAHAGPPYAFLFHPVIAHACGRPGGWIPPQPRLHLDAVGLVSLHALSLDYRANRFHPAVLTSMLCCVTNSLTGA
jgi:hypothetical protein